MCDKTAGQVVNGIAVTTGGRGRDAINFQNELILSSLPDMQRIVPAGRPMNLASPILQVLREKRQ
jgi:hypothetical protein